MKNNVLNLQFTDTEFQSCNKKRQKTESFSRNKLLENKMQARVYFIKWLTRC